LLFAVYLDEKLKEHNLEHLDYLAYADDVVFDVKNLAEMDGLIEKLENMGAGLVMNKKKSKVIMTRDSEGEDAVRGVEIVKKVKYLGFMLTCSTKEVKEMMNRRLQQCYGLHRQRTKTLPSELRI